LEDSYEEECRKFYQQVEELYFILGVLQDVDEAV
jgi:hypothetical protein